MLHFLMSQATNNPDALGVSVTSLVGSLGAAGAAVAVTYYFLGFLKTEGEKHAKLFEDFRDYHAESQKKFQEQLDRLTDRQEQSQRTFQDQVARLMEGQSVVLRDAIVSMKSVERTVLTIDTMLKQSVGIGVSMSRMTAQLEVREPAEKEKPAAG